MTERDPAELGGRPGRAVTGVIHDAFRRDLDHLHGAHPTGGQRFRFRDYSQQRLWAARWLLFEFPEVRNVVHLGDGVVAVLHDGDPRVRDWMALLEACGFAFEPVTEPSPQMEEI
jgi:hypothetical protein